MIKYNPENTLVSSLPPFLTIWLIQVPPDVITHQRLLYFYIFFIYPFFYFETRITKKILFFIIIFNITLELYDIIQKLSRQNTLIFLTEKNIIVIVLQNCNKKRTFSIRYIIKNVRVYLYYYYISSSFRFSTI